MKINSAEFVISAVRISQYPVSNLPEILLVGRSNVGKSSFINTITNRKKLARISTSPGKTRNLNFYLIDNKFYIVDVPGYGFASVSKKEQEKFGLMIEEYLETRECLSVVFLLVDFRHKPTDDDVQMYNYLKHYNIPTVIVATKVDKVSKNKWDKYINIIKNALKLSENDSLLLFSSINKVGHNDIMKKLDEIVGESI